MDRTAYIFPGQGSQAVGMGRALFDASPAARRAFEEADDALGEAISRLCFDGPKEALRLTANTQPAILATSVATWRAFAEAGAPPPAYAAGHSLGEYSALVAAGALAFGDALRLVRARGRLMQEAVADGEGAMAAVLGADRALVEAICAEAAEGDVCAIANYNCPGQLVIAGARRAIERAAARSIARGARQVIVLEVSAPFHTPLMRPAAERLRPLLARAAVCDPAFPIVANVSAGLVRTGEEARSALAAQVDAPVLWEQSVRTLCVLGVTRFVELGPGSVLAGLVKKIDRHVAVTSVGTPEALAAALGRARAAEG
jgi:[acyl-carrier-protein] S-malonyltransferase